MVTCKGWSAIFIAAMTYSFAPLTCERVVQTQKWTVLQKICWLVAGY